jgi:carboxylesterase
MAQIITTAEPFLFPGSRTGCLLMHGFTGTPKEMRWMGEDLARRGFSVLGIRLAGHATQPPDMIRSRWTDWVASVEDGYHLLCGLADHIYLVGLSMGGVLSLLMSTRLPVKGVVAISTPWLISRDWRLPYVRLFSWAWPYLRKSPGPPNTGWYDTEAWKDHVSYPKNPVRSIAELDRLVTEMRRALPDVRVPVLLVHSQDDDYVLPENVDHIYEELTHAPEKTRLLVSNSGHVVTREPVRQQVFEAAAQFILRLESQAG